MRPTRPGASPGGSTATPSARRIELLRPGPPRHRDTDHVTRPDAVVVGAGAIGAACAYELARAGLRVTVVERAEPGAEASGASAGILSVPDPSRRDSRRRARPAEPRPLRSPRRGAARGDRHRRRPRTYRTPPALHVAGGSPPGRAGGRRHGGARRGHLLRRPDDLRCLEPAVSPAALGALHLSRSSWVDNVQLVRALVRAGERRGVRYLAGQPVGRAGPERGTG